MQGERGLPNRILSISLESVLQRAVSHVAHFENEGHLENWLKNEFFAKHEKKFYKRLIKQLPLRWAKVVEYNGDYFDSSEFDV